MRRQRGGKGGLGMHMRLTLLGVGAMNSPRFSPAGLLIRRRNHAVAIDGGPGAEPPPGVAAWLVTDEHAELRAALRRLARERGLPAPAVGEQADGIVAVRPLPVEHSSHATYGYQIIEGGRAAVWAPEFCAGRTHAEKKACGAISLRRHYPDQVLGVAVRP